MHFPLLLPELGDVQRSLIYPTLWQVRGTSPPLSVAPVIGGGGDSRVSLLWWLCLPLLGGG